ncbi:MAG: hypothetical protein IPK83_25150 [Planctomycetes bacterium]|nr:hypothetical protein [Planctomycetota bacterium]
MNAPSQPPSGLGLKLDSSKGPIELAPLNRPRSWSDPRVPTIRVHASGAPATTPAKKRSVLLRTIGFMLVLLGVFVAFQTVEDWQQRFEQNSLLREIEAFALDKPLPPINLEWIEWARWLIGTALIAVGSICIGAQPIRFLLSALLFTGTAYVTAGLLSAKIEDWLGFIPTLPWIIAIAVGLAYCVHAIGEVSEPRLSAVLGLLFTGLAGAGILHGWFTNPAWIAKLGESSSAFVQDWKNELNWGIALFLTVIGVVSSRGKSIHFLNAVLLAALAYVCFQNGMVKVVTFVGTDWTPLEVRDIAYVPTWRWVMIAELALLACLLLHLSLGVGSLTLVFAIAWLAIALNVDREIGRGAILTYSKAIEVTMPKRPAPLESGGLRQGPADLIPMFGTSAQEGPQLEYSFAQKKALLRKATTRIYVTYLWIYFTAILAGLIGAAGLRLLIPNAKARTWATIAIWFAFGASAFWLWSIWPTSLTWGASLTALVVPRTHVYAIAVASLGMLAISSAWSLRADSRYTTWLYAATTVTFIGTAVTLVAIALLIKLTGHNPLPVWAYGAIAGGQSSLMWVLLIHQSDRMRKGLANS